MQSNTQYSDKAYTQKGVHTPDQMTTDCCARFGSIPSMVYASKNILLVNVDGRIVWLIEENQEAMAPYWRTKERNMEEIDTMSEITAKNQDKAMTIESREAARMVDKQHKDLMRDIRGYVAVLEKRGERNFAPTDYFIESTYTTDQNKELPCYLLTKKGCEFVSNKLTGEKGILFTAAFIDRFHEMEEEIANPTQSKLTPNEALQQKRLNVMEMNARTRSANLMLKMMNDERLSSTAVELLRINALEVLTGEKVDYRPALPAGKTYSATEVGVMYGISSSAVGSIAIKNNLKTDEFGEWVRDKSRHSAKQVDTFRYNQRGVDEIGKYVKAKSA